MDEDKDLEAQETLEPASEDADSQDGTQVGESEAEKIAQLEKDKEELLEKNKQLFARIQKSKEKSSTETSQTVPQTPDVDEIISKKFEERDLASLELSDDIKGEVKAYSKAKGIPVHEAAKSPYIEFLKAQEADKIREREASASTKGGGITAKRDFSSLAGEDIRKLDDESFAAYKEWLKSQE